MDERSKTGMKRPEHLCEGPEIFGHRVQHNEQHTLLVIDGRLIRLTPTEYRLVMLLLQHRERLLASPQTSALFVSIPDLQKTAALGNRPLLIKHLSNADAKLWTAGLTIARVADYGYVLVEIDNDTGAFSPEQKRQKPC
jgi:DNA-binding response OmpR family regulator